MPRPQNTRNAFTLIEILVVIAVIAVLLTIALPSFSRAVEMSYRARCQEHLRQLMAGHLVYAVDNNDCLPGTGGAVCSYPMDYPSLQRNGVTLPHKDGWNAVLPVSGDKDSGLLPGLLYSSGAVQDDAIWLCPNAMMRSPGDFPDYGWTPEEAEAFPYTYSYSYNYRVLIEPKYDTREWSDLQGESSNYGAKRIYISDEFGASYGVRDIKTFPNPAGTIVLAEEDSGWAGGTRPLNDPLFWSPPDMTEDRHLGESMVGYLDGHSSRVPPNVLLGAKDPVYGYDYWPVPPDRVYNPLDEPDTD